MKYILNFILLSLMLILGMRESYGTFEYEKEFNKGKEAHLQVISSLMGTSISEADLEANLKNRAYWENLRAQFIQVLQDPPKFKEITNLLTKSNLHLQGSRRLNPNFPYPYFYEALNYCVGGMVHRANMPCLWLEEKERKENVSPSQCKSPILREIIAFHHHFAAQENYAKEWHGFNQKVSGGLALLMGFGGELWFPEADFATRCLMFQLTEFVSSQVFGRLLTYVPVYPYFWPPPKED